MIDLFFEELKNWNPLVWGGFVAVIVLFFHFLKGLSKLVIILLILLLIGYSVFYFNPDLFDNALKFVYQKWNEVF
mgnify:FL=1|tara:strand:- start:511 stop:735 length:225 start_codon:yes stop_codon:yes gene_type:complete